MVGNNAVPWRNKPLPLHAPACLATFRQKKLEVARKKTMPIGIRNHANLIRFEGGDTEITEQPLRVRILLLVIAME